MDKNLEEVFVTQNNAWIHPPNMQAPYDFKTDYLHLGSLDEEWKELVLLDGAFVPRWMAEKDDTIVQIIPYVICCTDDRKILTYSRKGGGEGRLEGKKSIGIGGHINSGDLASFKDDILGWELVLEGAIRELKEEITIEYLIPDDFIEIGIIHTPSDGKEDTSHRETTNTPSVGAVHLGIVYMLRVPDTITIKENEGMINPSFMKISDASAEADKYEDWSRLILETLTEVKASNKQ